ncbi:Alpha-L-rhamnosidase [Fulvia fulva]|uniref:alpha-L-rhamnosidase n=1 Tax=Passalora fulva TaxID=5499 RepID=A0A9Q8L8J7_PASFU|nr:Alpha-L-rhamnosidase [Fulvia fulva]KAK4635824.1 Alpha-L-rhamnosidase [Fulvia fulva]KAK4638630.1 Alpha-L-rhamnosidase [Fulvia fulva]UJO12761.1 Alpha-L-rhamnosidase [Fulvia fulva]WPV08632.1 Alpha-L-rhamnosidase [Fulvia fulva]WPV24460.1 Alpha-L-rhamnosidase [Fulvia fulva]
MDSRLQPAITVHLFDEDGTHQTIISGPDWKVRKSATTLANIYASGTHDRHANPLGWDTPAFDDSSWDAAKPVTGPRGELKYQHQPPVVLHEDLEPVAIKTLKPGVVTYDLGQNSSIMTKIAVEGAAGSEVIIRYAETVNNQGYVLMPDPLFKEFETHVYSKFTLAGTGEAEVWEPDFSFTSARYIQVEGVAVEPGQEFPVIRSAVGQHVSTGAKRLGTMTTDKEDVNQLINACYWSFVGNLFSYHTDCPQIEKFGWLEVTHLLAPITQYIRDIESMHSKILEDTLDAQESSWFIPNMAPDTRFMCGPMRNCITWNCAICFIPDILKRYYGSTHMIKQVYPAAVRYIEYMSTWERNGGLIMHGLGDWGRDIAFEANIETAVYIKCLQCLEIMATELKIEADIKRFHEWAEGIHKVYNDNLLVTDDTGHPQAYYTSLDEYPKGDCIVVAQAIALQFDLVPEQNISDVQNSFLEDVSDGRLRSGEIGLRYLFNTLDDLHRPDLVLQVARQEEHLSYMRFLRRGETTLLEFWQDECRSKCHDMLGTTYEWMYAVVLGVKPTEEAYKTWSIRPPYESEFGEVKGDVECPYGLIEVHYERKPDGKINLNLTVPLTTHANLLLPSACGAVSVDRHEKSSWTTEAGLKSIELRPGQYTIVF